MILAFVAVFILAFAFTLLSFIFLEPDTKEKNYRPAYLLFIALIAWMSTIGLLLAPDYTTVKSPAYNVTTANVPLFCSGATVLTACGTTTEVVQYSAYNVTTASNNPFPSYGFIEYTAFAGAMALICLIFWIQFMLRMSIKEIGDGMKELA